MKLPMVIAALKPDIPLKKHTAIVHIEADFNATEHKLLNILYKSAFDAQEWGNEYYYVRLTDIKDFLGRMKINNADIEKNLEKLRTAKISWNILGQDQKNKEQWEQLATGTTGFIASWLLLEDRTGIRFSLSPEIKSMISNPNIYTYIDLQVQKKLTSKYEIILYELLADELNRSRRDDTVTRWYSIGDLLRVFGASPASYLAEMREFNRHCIRGPIDEINGRTDLTVEINDTTKVRNKIIAYRFKVAKKGKTDARQEVLDLSEDRAEENILINGKNYDVFDELTQLFNSRDTATKIFNYVKNKHHGKHAFDFKDLIIENIEYAKRSEKSAHNFPGFLRSAIENDYAGYETKIRKEAEEVKKADERLKMEEVRRKAEDDAALRRREEFEQREKARQENLSKHLERLNVVELPEVLRKSLFITTKERPNSEIWLDYGTQLFADCEKNLFFVAPHAFAVDQINNNYLDILKAAVSQNYSEIASLSITTAEAIMERFPSK
jgi:hypothetical protein